MMPGIPGCIPALIPVFPEQAPDPLQISHSKSGTEVCTQFLCVYEVNPGHHPTPFT